MDVAFRTACSRMKSSQQSCSSALLWTSIKLELTCEDRVADFSIAAHVFIQGFDLDHLGARRCLLADGGLITWSEEGWRVVVAVLDVNQNFCKVPLDRDLLVAHLKSSK